MTGELAAVFGAIRASVREPTGAEAKRDTPRPFITIARQAGAGGHTLARHLAEQLGEDWNTYDRELIEKAAQDHHLSPRLFEALTDKKHPWLTDVFAGRPSEITLYHRVAATVRALAQQGRAIIVGRGGVFVTRGMAGGVHVYLVAPLDCRVQRMAQMWNVDRAAAAKRVGEIDKNRGDFFKRYFPGALLTPETFHLTLNTAAMPEQNLVAAVIATMNNSVTSPT